MMFPWLLFCQNVVELNVVAPELFPYESKQPFFFPSHHQKLFIQKNWKTRFSTNLNLTKWPFESKPIWVNFKFVKKRVFQFFLDKLFLMMRWKEKRFLPNQFYFIYALSSCNMLECLILASISSVMSMLHMIQVVVERLGCRVL